MQKEYITISYIDQFQRCNVAVELTMYHMTTTSAPSSTSVNSTSESILSCYAIFSPHHMLLILCMCYDVLCPHI